MQQYLIFCLANQYYAIETTHVIQVAKEGEVTSLPFLPQHIKGLMLIRDHVIPIVNIATKWKVKPAGKKRDKGHIIVLEVGGQEIGYLVDKVINMAFLSEKDLVRIEWEKNVGKRALIHQVYIEEKKIIGIVPYESFL